MHHARGVIDASLLQTNLASLEEALRRQYGAKTSIQVSFQDRTGQLHVQRLCAALQDAARRATPESLAGLLRPGPRSQALYDRVRRIIRNQCRKEALFECGAPPAEGAPWEEAEESSDEATGSVLRDLHGEPESPSDFIQPDLSMNPPSPGEWPEPSEALLAAEEFGVSVFALSERRDLEALYCRHRFRDAAASGLTGSDPSCFELAEDLARLRESALETFLLADRALHAVLVAGSRDPTWGKAYRALQRVLVPT